MGANVDRDGGKTLAERVAALFKEHRYLDAAAVVPEGAEPGDAAEAVLASRLASRLGNERLASKIALDYSKKHPENKTLAIYRFLWESKWRRSPLQAYIESRKFLEWEYDSPDERGFHLYIAAVMAGDLRFLDEAERIIEECLSLDVSPALAFRMRVWFADISEDRAESARIIDAAVGKWRSSEIDLSPLNIHSFSALLWKYGRQKDALGLFEESRSRGYQYPDTFILDAVCRLESGDAEEAERSIELLEGDYVRYFDRDERQRLLGVRFQIAQAKGEREKMLDLAGQLKNKYFVPIRKRIESAPKSARRVILDVPLVAQKERTCVPATLAAISAYFGKSMNHDELAEKICADGTPDDKMVAWLDANGWEYRYFNFNIPDAKRLLGKGWPFALFTEGPDYKHCQAVVGLDEVTGELQVREPGALTIREFQVDEFIEEQAITGPKCMVFVPPEKASELRSLKLKGGVSFHDLLDVRSALLSHDLERARKAAEKISGRHPAKLEAEIMLAGYAGASGERLRIYRKSYMENKENELARWRYVSSLNYTDHSAERWKVLEEICDGTESPHPMFLQEFAHTLTLDHRQLDRAARIAEKAARRMPGSALCLYVLAFILGKRKETRDAAFLAYKAAAMIDVYSEHFHWEWLNFANQNHRGEEVLKELERRIEKLGGKTAAPAITLADALWDKNRNDEALGVLRRQIERYDEFNEARLRLAELLASVDMDKALESVDALRPSVNPSSYRMTRGLILSRAGRWRDAMEVYAAEVAECPDNTNAFSAYLRLKARLEEYSHRFFEEELSKISGEGCVSKLETLAFLGKEPHPRVFLDAAERIVEIDPFNPFWLREIAFFHAERGEVEKAVEFHAKAAEIAEGEPQTLCLAADIALERGSLNEARRKFIGTLEIDVNYGYVYERLVLCAPGSEEEKLEMFDRIIGFIRESAIDEACVSGVSSLADNILSAERAERILEEIKEHRPDIPQVWIELSERMEGEAAAEFLEEATERFPYNPFFKFKRAALKAMRGGIPDALVELDVVLKNAPLYARARCYKAFLLDQLHRRSEAEAELRMAVDLEPSNMVVTAELAEYLMAISKRSEAMEILDEAIGCFPNSQQPWSIKLRLLQESGAFDEAAEMAEEMARRFPWEASACLDAADAMIADARLDRALEFLEKARRLAPKNEDVYNKRISILIRQRDYDAAMKLAKEAAETCQDVFHFKFQRASILRLTGKKKRAYVELGKIAKESRNPLRYDFILADWYIEDEEMELAEKQMKANLEAYPDSPSVAMSYAEFLENAERLKGARAVYEGILEKHPDYAPALCGVFDTLAMREVYAKALGVLEDAVEKNPSLETTPVLCRMATAACVLGQWKKASRIIHGLAERDERLEPNTFLVMRNNLPPRSKRRVKLLSLLRKQLGRRYSRELAEGIARIYIAAVFDGAGDREVGWFFSVASLCREALENDDPEPIALLILNKRFMSIMPIFELFIRKHIDFIRSHDATWKAMVVHYAHTGKFSANLEWTEGWNERASDFKTLASRLTSLYALERFDEARELALEAVERLPFDDGAPDFAAEAYYLFALAEDWSTCDRFEAYGELDKKPPGIRSMPGELFAIGKNMREFAESPSDGKIKKAKNLGRSMRWRPLPTPKLPAKKARKKFRKWILSLR